jgi:hypothetical protein
LIGDASYDSRVYHSFGFHNYIPTRIVTTLFSEAGSDEALADFNNDGLAEMAIGRIPARSGAQITTALAKVTNWEANLGTALSRGALFAFDVPNGYGFRQLSEGLAAELVPAGIPTSMAPRGMVPPLVPPNTEFTLDPNAQTNLIAGLNSGKYIVNYSGHGSAGSWVNEFFFSKASVPLLTNQNNESVFVMLTCLNGEFLNPNVNLISLSETLIWATNGGGVAAWSSTGLTTPDLQEQMGLRFYDQLAQGNIPRLGDLIKDAKAQVVGGEDVRLSWALLGDPTLKMR